MSTVVLDLKYKTSVSEENNAFGIKLLKIFLPE